MPPMKRLISLALVLALCVPAFSATLESESYEAGRWAEPLIPAGPLDETLLAQREIDVNVRHLPEPPPRASTLRQKRTMLAFMAAGGLIGGLTGGVFGFVIGFFGAAGVWYLLDGAELLPASWR